MSLGEAICDLRKKNNLTQEELAYRMGVSRQIISQWENDKIIPTFKHISLLSDIFKCGKRLKSYLYGTELAVTRSEEDQKFTSAQKLFIVIINLVLLCLLVSDIIIGILALPNFWRDEREAVSVYIDPSVFWILIAGTVVGVATEIYAIICFKKDIRSKK